MSDGTEESDRLLRENQGLRRRVAALEAEAERFKTTLQSIGDAVISVDTGGNILQINPVAGALTGWGEGEALGQPLARVFRITNEDTRTEVESPVGRVLREGAVGFKTLKGKPIWCHITGVRTTKANGQICFDNTMEDITERKRMET